MIVIVMFVALALVAVYVFRAVLLSWSSAEERSGIDIVLDRAVEEMVRELREATAVNDSVNDDEIRFTTGGNSYIYYLYNATDGSYPPNFDQATYDLKRTTLVGGIAGTFTYGSGRVIITDVVPPPIGSAPQTDLSVDADNLVTIILKITRDDETITTKTQMKPRDL